MGTSPVLPAAQDGWCNIGTSPPTECEMKQPDPLPWPDGCAGAVSLTLVAADDGHPSHLDCVAPLLAEFGLHATFYVNPRGDTEAEWRARLAPWQAVQAAGHEVGNHSLSHTCSRALGTEVNRGRPALEEWSLADVELHQ